MDKKRLRKLFGKKLRSLRKNKGRGLSQEELAEKAGIHPTYIGVIERGEQAPTLDTVEKIAKALNVEIKELFLFSADESDKAREGIITSLAGKNPKTLQKILNVIRAMEE